jgi:hypothetical protein
MEEPDTRYVGRARLPAPEPPPACYGPPSDPWAPHGPDGTREFPPFTDGPYTGPTGAFVLPVQRPRVLARRGFPRVLGVLLSLLGLFCAGGVAFALATRGADLMGTAPPEPPGVGDPVRDGRFEFVVKKVTCGHDTVGQGFVTIPANGQFCLVRLTVTNISDESQAFADSFQKALGAGDAEYGANTAAGLVANQGTAVVWHTVNPGITVSGTIVYDIPREAELTGLRLHDSLFSGGVTVTI